MPTLFPYPGLRPFQEDEADIFFGREEQTDQLLEKLNENRFLAIVGVSGCGKSSLAKAGMVSALKTGFMAPAGTRWRIAVMRPGNHPIKHLAEALYVESVLNLEQNWGSKAIPFLDSTLRRGPLGLVEILRQSPIPPGSNLLILVDQFEELFRFRDAKNMNEQDAFIDLLLKTADQREFPVYIVITMRSDYLGDCAIFPGLPETLNTSQYLTPRLNRDQREKAIVGPAHVFCGDIEPSLVNRLLNESGSDPNLLPVLQHVLMRMWSCTVPQENYQRRNILLEDVPEKNLGHLLTTSDYEKVGGLTEALSRHADEAYNELNDEQKRIAEILFRSLCERGTERRDGRHPTAIGIIADQAGVTSDRIIEIVKIFRKPEYGFLLPAPPENLYEDTIIDITHESLIRVWKRLSAWVEQEVESSQTYSLLMQTALRWEKGQAALYGTPDLEMALEWKKNQRPTKAWAERYGGNFDISMEFLDASEKDFRIKEEEEEQRRIYELQQAKLLADAERKSAEVQKIWNRRLRYAVYLLIILLIAGGIYAYWYLDRNVWEHAVYYNTFSTKFGIPVGVGKLNSDQVKNRPWSLKLIKKGSKKENHVFRMQAVNSKGELTTAHNIGTYFDEGVDYHPTECQWEFICDEKGKIVYEMAYNKNDQFVWGLSYAPALESNANIRNAYFLMSVKETEKKSVGVAGANQSLSKPSNSDNGTIQTAPENSSKEAIQTSGTSSNQGSTGGNEIKTSQKSTANNDVLTNLAYSDRSIRIEYSDQGYEIKLHYQDRNGNPIPGPDKAYGREQSFYKNGLVSKMTSLDITDKPMNDNAGNSSLELSYDDLGNVKKAVARDINNKLIDVKDGWAILESEYDNNGNQVVTRYFDKNNNRTNYHDYTFSEWKATYNNGNITKQEYFDANENPVAYSNENKFSSWEADYDEKGNQLLQEYFDVKGNPVNYSKNDNYAGWRAEYDNEGNRISQTYFDVNKKPVIIGEGYYYSSWKARYYKGNLIGKEYYDTYGKRAAFSNYYNYSSWTAEYDNHNNKIMESYLDVNGNPVKYSADYNYASWRAKYDVNSKEIMESYFDENGKPVNYSQYDTYASWTAEYDEDGNRVKLSYLDVNDKPVKCSADLNYAYWKARYYKGNMVMQEYFDVNDKPVTFSDYYNYSIVKTRYDSYQNRIMEAYFDINNKPVRYGKDYNYASWRAEYDKNGYQVMGAIFDVDGKPVNYKGQNYASWKAERDVNGNETRVSIFDINGKPVNYIGQDYASWKAEYDDQNNQILSAVFDVNGKPVNFKGQSYASWRAAYDNNHNLIFQAYYDVNGKPVNYQGQNYASWKAGYNESGHQIMGAVFDKYGKPVNYKDESYASWKAEFDDNGNQIMESYFDVDGNPVNFTDQNYASWKAQYNENGNKIMESYFNKDGKPVNYKGENYASWKAEYDRNGNEIMCAVFDVNGAPVNYKNQDYSSWKAEYDSDHHIIFQSYFDVHGNPINYKGENYASWKAEYNENGRQIMGAIFDVDGKPVNYKGSNYASWKAEYDKNGYILKEQYFDVNGKPISKNKK